MSAFDWPAALRAAVLIGLKPHEFWRLSLAEWRALTARDPAFGHADLARLMAAFPDGEPDDHTP
jgi:uncharacterized phage protein (TIGR02216 family)